MKLKQLSMLLIAAIVVVFTGCSKDDGTKQLTPTITFAGDLGYISHDDSVDAGTVIKIKTIAQKGKDGAKLKNFKLAYSNTGGSATIVDSTLTSASDETFNYTYTSIPLAVATTYTFTITDKDGKTTTKSIKVTIKGGPSITTPKSEIARSFNHKGAFDLEGLTSQGGDVAPSNPSDYDLYYFNSGTSGGNFVVSGSQNSSELSTFAAAWAGSSNVQIKSTTADYAAATAADESGLTTIFNNGTPVAVPTGSSLPAGSRQSQLAAGQVYSIRTSSGKYALVKVTAVSGTSVTIDFLIQH